VPRGSSSQRREVSSIVGTPTQEVPEEAEAKALYPQTLENSNEFSKIPVKLISLLGSYRYKHKTQLLKGSGCYFRRNLLPLSGTAGEHDTAITSTKKMPYRHWCTLSSRGETLGALLSLANQQGANVAENDLLSAPWSECDRPTV
jgi:hypothetical protein